MQVRQILNERPRREKDAENVSFPTGKRVAAYARVSTDAEGQSTSFETQVHVLVETVEHHPGWISAGVYADRGISGTSAEKRPEFQRMMEDAKAGKIDIILTKSISRFARNTIECINYVRELKEHGVRVIFEKENIDTGTAFSEMLLTVLAAFAQEESRSISENQKWTFRKKFEEGKPRWSKLYGYRKGVDGEEYVIVPEEARIVKETFDRCERGETCKQIAEAFDSLRYPTPSQKAGEKAQDGKRTLWNTVAINGILKNERYIGDVLMQKTYTVDHLSHRYVKNDQSVVPSYYARNHHAAIISREQFERVNRILRMRNSQYGPRQYPFDDKLVCPICGNRLVQRRMEVLHCTSTWRCEREGGCGRYALQTKIIVSAVLSALHGVAPEEVTASIEGKQRAQKEKGQALIAFKRKHPSLKKVDYYWVDDLIDHITFGLDSTLTVHWKCGLNSSVPLDIRHHCENPFYVADVYNKKKEEGTVLNSGKYQLPEKNYVSVDVLELIKAE